MKPDNLKQMIFIPLFTAITIVLSYIIIPLPFSPVPVTCQTIGVMLAGNLLTPKSAFISMFLYLLLGIMGLPIFAGGASGISSILGPSGGYLISWPISAFISASILKNSKKNFSTLFIVNVISGILLIYLLGVTQLSYVTKMGFVPAIISGALPFIPGDIAKAALSATISLAVQRALRFNVRKQSQ